MLVVFTIITWILIVAKILNLETCGLAIHILRLMQKYVNRLRILDNLLKTYFNSPSAV